MTDDEQEKEPVRPDVPGHRIDAVIGVGGSAVVWSGADPTGRRVAIKVPHRERDETDVRQSLAEQQVLLAVQHEHLVPLRAVVPLTDGREALVFDLVSGAPLAGMVAARGHLRPGEVVTVLSPVCEAVAHLHGAGGVHADISASNITVTPEGRPVLLDLGAVRVAGRDDESAWGTPGFVAPEVRLGEHPDEAADVYALGAVAWFCLTGNGAPDTMMRLDHEIVVSHVGAELAEVVATAIDPEPERRPSAAELARLFYDAAAAEVVEVVVAADDASALTHRLRADAEREAPPPSPHTRRWAGRWSRRVLVPAGLALPLLVAVVWALAARTADAATSSTAGTARVTTPGAVAAASKPAGTKPAPSRPAAPQRATAEAAMAADRVVRDAASPSTRPEDLLQALSDRRSVALAARDSGALAGVHAPSSPSEQSDRTLVTGLLTARTRWEGLRLEVAEALFVSGSTREAVLRARVDWTAYVVVASDGTRSPQPADTGRVLDFRLTRGAEGWRISAISAAPAT